MNRQINTVEVTVAAAAAAGGTSGQHWKKETMLTAVNPAAGLCEGTSSRLSSVWPLLTIHRGGPEWCSRYIHVQFFVNEFIWRIREAGSVDNIGPEQLYLREFN